MKKYRKRKPLQGVNKTTETPFFAPLQKKLKVGEPGDKYEVEADAMAAKVTQASGSADTVQKMGETEEETLQQKTLAQSVTTLQKQELNEEEPAVQKQEEEETLQTKEEEETLQSKEEEETIQTQEEEETLQTKEEEETIQQKSKNNSSRTNIESKIKNSKGKGNTMDPKTLQLMESQFGASFKHIKIHTDAQAEELCEELGAQAFTNGNDIFFNKGKYNPNSNTGKHLLAHELTHTIQQSKK
jgi:hypothetical protein